MSWTFEDGTELGGATLSTETIEGERLCVWRVGDGIGKSKIQRTAALRAGMASRSTTSGRSRQFVAN